jgi:amino acid permease
LIVTASQFAFQRAATYGELGQKAFGPRGHYYTEGCIILFLIGAQVSYLKLIGDFLTPLLIGVGANVSAELVSGVVAAVVILPLSSLRRMDSLRFTSFVALFFIFCLAVGVLVKSSQQLSSIGIKYNEFSWLGKGFQGIFVSLPVLNFAFTFHPSVPPVWKELINQSPTNINFICLVSVLFCGIFYALLGLFGYIYQYAETPSNIILGYAQDYLFIGIRIGYSLVIIFSYPVLNFATRNGLDSLLFKTEAPWWRYVIESVIIVGITYAISILVPTIDIIFGLTGATFGQLVIFINPALFYIFLYDSTAYEEYDFKGRITGNETRRDLNLRFFFTPKKLVAFLLIVAGLVCGVVSVTEIALRIEDINECVQKINGTCLDI